MRTSFGWEDKGVLGLFHLRVNAFVADDLLTTRAILPVCLCDEVPSSRRAASILLTYLLGGKRNNMVLLT